MPQNSKSGKNIGDISRILSKPLRYGLYGAKDNMDAQGWISTAPLLDLDYVKSNAINLPDLLAINRPSGINDGMSRYELNNGEAIG